MILMLAMTLTAAAMSAQTEKTDVMTKQKDGTYVINTTTLSTAKGYRAQVPLEVTVKKNKIVKVTALPNKETPKYFMLIKNDMLPKYEGLKITDHESVDGITGATISSNAVKANVKAAVDYYQKNK